jgi:ribose transport system permease protein
MELTGRKFSLGLDKFSGLYLWGLFIVLFSFMAPRTFPTMNTVHLLASTQAIAAIVALALLVPMVTGQFDLSIGAIANFSGILAVIVQTNGLMDPAGAILLGTAAGAVIGMLNGLIVVKLKIDSFITTLAMGSILSAFQVIVTNNREPLPVANEFFTSLTQTSIFGFQMVFLYMIVIALIVWWLLERTPAGRYMRATGFDREAARLSGVQVDRWSFLSLTISGTICGFAGVLFVSLAGPSLGFGPSLLLPAFAAVFLGSTQLVPGRHNVWGTVLAIFVLATGVQGLQLVSGAQWVASMFNGVALIAAVGLAVSRRKKLSRSKKEQRIGKNEGGGSVPASTNPDGQPSTPLVPPADRDSAKRIEV